MLHESPSFLAVKGDAAGCAAVLESIARINGKPPMQVSVQAPLAPQETPPYKGLLDVTSVFGAAVASHWRLLLLLSVIDSGRAFFISGSSYLWKDLFSLARNHMVSPAMLNIIASLAPLIGLFISERFLWMGVRRITFLSAMAATISLGLLILHQVRMGSLSLLLCIMATKLMYGPLNTCIALIKAESFPTEIRVSAYSLISVAAKVTCMLAPTIIEVWKDDELAESWSSQGLTSYLVCLMVALMACGVLVMTVPGGSGDGRELSDFFDNKRVQRMSPYGSCGNIWELAEHQEAGQGASGMARSSTSPILCHG
mmetsp:Transcript_98100/g.316353  ORF Transcript_98100/g.316353 Transcript_98100/m.316353 type:complete len:313 (-) Transcript_98100:127-1065(-)